MICSAVAKEIELRKIVGLLYELETPRTIPAAKQNENKINIDFGPS